eukprot:scaffold526690_cov46-Prasinocladus_malaysianus.AAC.1
MEYGERPSGCEYVTKRDVARHALCCQTKAMEPRVLLACCRSEGKGLKGAAVTRRTSASDV